MALETLYGFVGISGGFLEASVDFLLGLRGFMGLHRGVSMRFRGFQKGPKTFQTAFAGGFNVFYL